MYKLVGTALCPQVDPDAAWWLNCPVLSTPSIEDVLDRIGGDLGPHHPDGSPDAIDELEQLRTWNGLAHRPLVDLERSGDVRSRDGGPYLSRFLTDAPYTNFFPHGAVLPVHVDGNGTPDLSKPRPITTGAELASLFEAETPGLWQRHVFNVFMAPQVQNGFCQRVSPPRLALAWSALDLSIMTALSAAWNTKWLGLDGTRYRARPWEVRLQDGSRLPVLFDTLVNWEDGTGAISRRNPKTTPGLPQDGPGSPRHPAFPSGHSTYSGAASRIMSYLFPFDPSGNDLRPEYLKLADNIGEARLWGGVHWRSDHERGLVLGEKVADLILDQLRTSGVLPIAAPHTEVPDADGLREQASRYDERCGNADNNFCGGVVPPDLSRKQTQELVVPHEQRGLFAF